MARLPSLTSGGVGYAGVRGVCGGCDGTHGQHPESEGRGTSGEAQKVGPGEGGHFGSGMEIRPVADLILSRRIGLPARR